MVFSSSIGESMVYQILPYYQIVLNINDRTVCIYVYRNIKRFVYIYIYIYIISTMYIYIYIYI